MVSLNPDFNRLKTAIHFDEPDRLPLVELWVDAEVKAAFLGNVSATELDCRKAGFNVVKDIEFWHLAGYDYIRLTPRYEFFQTWLKNAKTTDFEEQLDRFLLSIDYSDIEKAEKLLPPGMKVIFAPEGGIFEQAWMNLGYEKFMTDLYENPEYIERVCNVIGAAGCYVCKNQPERFVAVFGIRMTLPIRIPDFISGGHPSLPLSVVRKIRRPGARQREVVFLSFRW
jgi:hypothetical protein